MVKLAAQSVDTKWLEGVSQEYGIPYKDVLDLYLACQSSREALLAELEARNMKESLPKVIVFRNGILVGSSFYDANSSMGRELLEMLEKNEFDKDIFESTFGTGENEVDLVVEKRDEEYSSSLNMSDLKKEIDTKNTETKRRKVTCSEAPQTVAYSLPVTIAIGPNPSIKFKAVFGDSECVVRVNPELRVQDVMEHFSTRLGLHVYLTLGGEVLDENESVAALSNAMVRIENCC